MPRSGGEADKLGNRYEGIWTVSQLLELLTGQIQSLCVEPYNHAEAVGIEFVTRTFAGSSEFHSAKRQHSDGEWSLAKLTNQKLGRSILCDLFDKLAQDPTHHCRFVSSTGANDLRELTERSKRCLTVKELQASLRDSVRLKGEFENRILPIASGELEMAFAWLRRTTVALIDEHTLICQLERQVDLLLYRPDGREVSATSVRTLLADYIITRLGSNIVRDEVLTYLGAKGYHLRDWSIDPSLQTQIRTHIDQYLRSVELELINRSRIVRSEAQAIATSLTQDESTRYVLLTAPAGYGKSCVVAQVIRQLQGQQIPVLVVRLDRHCTANSPRDIGRELELPSSPAIVLNGISNGTPSVLIIDQLDALSRMSGRSPHLWYVFDQLREEVLAAPNMKLILVCRTFDMENDDQLRTLMRQTSQFRRVDLELLAPQNVADSLNAKGIQVDQLTSHELEILRTPLNLLLYLEGHKRGSLQFTGVGQLFHRYWKRKQKTAQILHEQSSWAAAIFAVCDELSRRQALTTPECILDRWPEATQLLISEHVLIRDGSHVRFFHESFFDYAYARQFCSRQQGMVEWLTESEQHLFRRAQLRQILEYLREDDLAKYAVTLGQILRASSVRFHLKKMVLQWIGALPSPNKNDWGVIEPLIDDTDLGKHVLVVLRANVAWFDLLHQNGTLCRWLNSGNDRWIGIGFDTFWFVNVRRARSAVIAELLRPFHNRDAEWNCRLRAFFRQGDIHHSTEMQRLFLDLLTADFFNVPNDDLNESWWKMLHDAVNTQPTFIIDAISSWLGQQIAMLERMDVPKCRMHVPNYDIATIVYPAANHEPETFARRIFPQIMRLVELTPDPRRAGRDLIWPYRFTDLGRHPYDAILSGLIQAMRQIATHNPAIIDELTTNYRDTESETIAFVLLRAWGANASYFSVACATFLARRESWLNFGYNSWSNGGNGHAAISRETLSLIVPHLTIDQRNNLEMILMNYVADWELDSSPHVGYTAHLLLEAIGENNLTESGRERLLALRTLFPNSDLTLPTEHNSNMGRTLSPIPPEETQNFNDDEWLTAMRKHNRGHYDIHSGPTQGTADELSDVLRRQVRFDRLRFARLIMRMEDTINADYFSAILDGLMSISSQTAEERTADEAAFREFDTEELLRVIRRLHQLPGRPCGRAICRAFGQISNRTIPITDLAIIEFYAIEHPDPHNPDASANDENSLWVDSERMFLDGINTVRGSAVCTVADLLFGDYSRAVELIPVLERVANDLSPAVRACLFRAIIPLLNHATDGLKAVNLCLIACKDSDVLLACNTLERFIHYASARFYRELRPLLFRMLNSGKQLAVRAAARQICLAAFNVDEAIADVPSVLDGSVDMRFGAAEVFSLNLSEQAVEMICVSHLKKLFKDESQDVRRKAAHCFLHLEHDDIGRHGELVEAYVKSPAYPSSHDDLLYKLAESTLPLSEIILQFAVRFLDKSGSKANDIQYAEFADASQVAKLVVRLYVQTSDESIKQQCLNLIDKMEYLGVYGLRNEMDQVDR